MKKAICVLVVILSVIYASLFVACAIDIVQKISSGEDLFSVSIILAFSLLAAAYLLLQKISAAKWILLTVFMWIMGEMFYMDIFCFGDKRFALLYSCIAAVFLIQIISNRRTTNDAVKSDRQDEV